MNIFSLGCTSKWLIECSCLSISQLGALFINMSSVTLNTIIRISKQHFCNPGSLSLRAISNLIWLLMDTLFRLSVKNGLKLSK